MNFNTNVFPQKNVTNVRLFTKIDNDNNGVPYLLERNEKFTFKLHLKKYKIVKHINKSPHM